MKFYRLLIKLYIIIVLGEIAYTNPTVSISSIVSSITDRPIPITITFSELVTGFESSDVIVSNGTINYLEDFESGSFGTLPWNFGGNYSWNWDIAEAGTWGADGAFDIWWPPDAVYDGNYCAYSKNLIDSQWSEMNLSLNVTASDTISFFYSVSSEANYDFFSFHIDGNLMDEWAGGVGWTEASYPVSSGEHTFHWRYSKDNIYSSGTDRAKVDYIILPQISAPTSSGETFKFLLTPTNTGLVTIDIPESICIDGVGNPNIAGSQFSISYSSSPVPFISSIAVSPTSTSPISIEVTFGESVTSFDASDVVIGNGIISSFSGSGTTYTFDVFPIVNGVVTVDIPADVAVSTTTGENNMAAAQFSITYDGTNPTVTLSSTATSPTNIMPIPITVTFGESVNGFTGGDIVVSGGTVTNFWGFGASYTFDLVPSGTGLITVDVPTFIAESNSGNPNIASNQFSIIYNTNPSAPGGVTVSRETAGSALTLSWNQNSEGDVTKYRIFMDASFEPTTLIDSTLSVSDITKTISSLNNGSDYYFRIVAVDSFGFVSSNSSEVSESPAELVFVDHFDDLYNWANIGADDWITSTEGYIENCAVADFSSTGQAILSKTINFSDPVALRCWTKQSHIQTGGDWMNLSIDSEAVFSSYQWDQGWNNWVQREADITVGSHNIKFSANSSFSYGGNEFYIDEIEFWKKYAPNPAISSTLSSLTNSSAIPITITFSESVTDFEEGDIVVTNGTISSFTGSGTDYSFNIEPSDDGLVTVNVPADIAVGTSGQNNMAAAQFSITYDGTNPTVTITSTESSPTDNTPIQTAVNFSESVTGFELSDIAVTNGAASNFSGSGASYSFDLSPTTNGYVSVDIASSKAQDSANNPNAAADQFSILYDSNLFIDHFDNLTGWINTTNSTNSNELWYISEGYVGNNGARSDVGGYGYGDQLSRSFTFNSEVIVKIWVKKQAGDAVRIYFKVNGEEYWKFGDIGDPGSTWEQKEITIPAGTHTISIETDFAGYAWIDELEIGTNFSPVPVITSSYSSPTSNSPIPVDVNFSKAVTGFEQGDVSIVNGSAGNFIGSGASYSFNITPSSDGTVTVDIAEDVTQDDENNGNISAQRFNIVYDSTQPSAALSSSSTSPTNTSPFPVEIVFSEDVSNFVPEIISIVNGAVSAFSGSDLVYNINVAPSADGNVKISLPANSVYDLAGNSNIASNMLEIYYDNLHPDVDVDDIISAGTQDILTIQWQSTDVSAIDIHNIYLTNDGQNYSLLSSVAGNVFTYDWTVPNILYDQNKIAVEAVDEWGLVSSDTTNVFSILDNDPPLVSIIEPAESYSILEYNDLNVKWSASDNIGLDSMRVYYSNDGGDNFLQMGSVMADLNEFTVEVPFGVTYSAQIRLLALDIYDNEGEAVSEYFSVTDNTLPAVEITTPETSVTGQNTAISWSASDNTGLESHHLYLSSDNGVSFTFVDSTLGELSSYNWQVPDSLVCNDCRFKIITYDLVRLSAEDVSEAFIIEDGIPPEVVVTFPVSGYSIPEYNELTVTWSATDNIKVSDSIRIYYSNNGTSFTEMGSSFTVPSGVTDNAQVKVVVLDGSNNEGENISELFSVTDNTPPTVDIISPVSGDTFTIGKSENITWSEEDNVGITDREFAWSVDGVSWTDFYPDLIEGSSLWFITPNQPTVNFMVRVIVSDAVALSDISVASGIHLVIEYPTLLSYTGSDSTFLSLQQGNDILVEFSVAMDSASIINISLGSMVFGNINYTVSEISSSIYNLNVDQQLASLDTLTLTLPVSLQSSYGYGFDGDGDGLPGDGKEIDIYTEALADFDHNGSIDFTDLTTFITAWYADSYSKELGPFTGNTPHLIPAFDNAFDIEDIVAFMFMWNWSDDFSPSNMARMDEMGVPPIFIIENDILSLNLSKYEENIAAVHLQLNTFQPAINVISKGLESGFDISLPRRWEEENIYEWNFGNPQGKDIGNIDICRFETTLSQNQDMLIDYEIISSNGSTLSSGSTTVEYIPIPDDFALIRAYPNPFNPITQIQYALPEDIHVELVIYDIMGRQVTELVSTEQQAGYHKVVWNGNNNASGLYFATMSAGDFISTQKLMLVK